MGPKVEAAAASSGHLRIGGQRPGRRGRDRRGPAGTVVVPIRRAEAAGSYPRPISESADPRCGYQLIPSVATGQCAQPGERGASHGVHAAVLLRDVVAWVRGASAGFYLFGRLPAWASARARSDHGRHARPGRRAEAHSTADPAGDTPGGHDRAAGQQALDYSEISMRQITQQILPAGLPPTTVWGRRDLRRAAAAC